MGRMKKTGYAREPAACGVRRSGAATGGENGLRGGVL